MTCSENDPRFLLHSEQLYSKLAVDTKHSREAHAKFRDVYFEDRAREKRDFNVVSQNSTATGRTVNVISSDRENTSLLVVDRRIYSFRITSFVSSSYLSSQSFFLNANNVRCTPPPINIECEFIIVRSVLQSLELLPNPRRSHQATGQLVKSKLMTNGCPRRVRGK